MEALSAKQTQLNAHDVFPQSVWIFLFKAEATIKQKMGHALIMSSQGSQVRSSLVITRLHKLACLVKKGKKEKKHIYQGNDKFLRW